MARPKSRRSGVLAALGLALLGTDAHAFELLDGLTIDTVASAGGECERVDSLAGDDLCGAGALAQPQVRWEPFEGTRFTSRLGLAAGNGLNERTPFNLSPWAADLADVVTNINGRGRDVLLTANYRQTLSLGTARHLVIVGGIIDATDYIDTNAFANDELNQFMNEALVNAVLVAPPSYDYGGALIAEVGRTALRAVYMNVGANDNGASYNYFAGELAQGFDTRWGTGNVRVLVSGTDAAFATPHGGDLAQQFGVSVSADQTIADAFGLFARAGWQLDSAAVDYGAEITAGAQLKGAIWGREHDSVGLGAGVLFGGNLDLERTFVAELYYRATIREGFSVTFDLQTMRDVRRTDTVHGVIAGLRATASF